MGYGTNLLRTPTKECLKSHTVWLFAANGQNYEHLAQNTSLPFQLLVYFVAIQ